jgi:hypothetical protein
LKHVLNLSYKLIGNGPFVEVQLIGRATDNRNAVDVDNLTFSFRGVFSAQKEHFLSLLD